MKSKFCESFVIEEISGFMEFFVVYIVRHEDDLLAMLLNRRKKFLKSSRIVNLNCTVRINIHCSLTD